MKQQRRKVHFSANPGRVLAFSFFAIILVGTALLTLPVSSRDGTWTSPLTALFTATSATCVTGLATVDTGLWWSGFGQAVILVMIQLGGLGFMTVFCTCAILLRRRLSISRQMVLMGALNVNTADDAVGIAKHAVLLTLAFEGAGAAVLAVRFVPQYGRAKGIWYGVFHAVSAFCNAGFDLVGGMANYVHDPVVNLTLITLIICSGLGFFVWEELLWHRERALSLPSRLVLLTTVALVVSGTVFFLLLEWDGAFHGFSGPEKLLAALFQSVTLRTAGFSTVDQGTLTESSQALSIFYMLIGGGSGSTAGGIKVGTAAVLALALRSGLHGRERVTVRGRTIPHRQVFNAMTLTLLVVMAFFAGAVFLSVREGLPFLAAAFETASAIATVGLSTGITASLSAQSQAVLICLMYLGRVGILSFSFAVLTHRPVEEKISYPYVDMMIG
ncbi:MAG: TrkH family potassium uptake protein [Clostridiales bacterium]|nr:TrkH family potassium uptake protein [Clostridiales bacterium]